MSTHHLFSQIRYFTLVALTLFFGATSLSHAENSKPLAEGQTVEPSALLQFQDEPGHYFFIGKADRGYHVFEIVNGTRRERLMKGNSVVYYDGGSLDLYLEDGTRLAVPADHDGPKWMRESTGPAVTFTHRPRELLERVAITPSAVGDLGLTTLLPENYFAPAVVSDRPKKERPPFLTHPENAVLFRLMLQGVSTHKAEERIKKLIKALPAGQAYLMERGSGSIFGSSLLVGVDPAIERRLLKALGKISGATIETMTALENITPIAADIALIGATLDAKNGSLSSKIGALAALNSMGPDAISVLSGADKATLSKGLLHTLSDLDTPFHQVYESAYYQRRLEVSVPADSPKDGFWGDSAYIYQTALPEVPSHPLYKHFAEPLRAAEVQALQLLHDLATPESTRKVLEAAHAGRYAGIDLMGRTLPSGGNYLDAWLAWFSDAINEANAITPEIIEASNKASNQRDTGWSRLARSGGIFENLRVSGNLTYWYRTENSVVGHGDITRLESTPLVLLGLNLDARAERKKIIQFIINSDATVAAQLAKENAATAAERQRRMYSTPATGNTVLNAVIAKLAYSAEKFDSVSGFSRARYYGNVLDIFIELVETSNMTLHTPGTYHAVLDASLKLIRDQEESRQIDLGEEVAQKILRLSRAIQTKLVGALRFAEPDASRDYEGCPALLSPRPAETWRRR